MRTTLLTPGEQDHREVANPVVHGFALNEEALSGLALVRRFRLADMCDRETVIQLISAVGCRRGASWLYANPHLYFLALRQVEARLREAEAARAGGGS